MRQAGKLFLSGGGDEHQSLVLDQQFVADVGPTGEILYLPMAQQGDSRLYAGCFQWFAQTMKMHAIPESRITMWTSFTNRQAPDFTKFSGIYIGGGMTGTLCRLMRDADLQTIFPALLESAVAIYGGSAGDIALGQSLLCIPEEMLGTSEEDSKGLGLIPNSCFRCHFRADDSTDDEICRSVSKQFPTLRILALPETSGLIYGDGECAVVGQDPVFGFSEGERFELKPGATYNLTSKTNHVLG